MARRRSNNSPRKALRLGAERLHKAGVASARLDMSLSGAALGTDRLGLTTNLDRTLSDDERRQARELLHGACDANPWLISSVRRVFRPVTGGSMQHVLIPRPETNTSSRRRSTGSKRCSDAARFLYATLEPQRAIAVAVARRCPRCRWIARMSAPTCSPCPAQCRASRCCRSHRFVREALYEPVGNRWTRFAAIAICGGARTATLEPEVAQWETGRRVFSGEDGLIT